jgi:putative transposase
VKLVKTLRAKVHSPTRYKREALLALHNEWQKALHLPREYGHLRTNTNLTACYCRDIRWCVGKGNHSPVILGQGALNLRPGGRFAPWFASIPTPLGRVRVPLRLAPEHSRLLAEPGFKLGMCRLVKNGPNFYLHIVVEREVPDIPIPVNAPVLAVDIGEKTIATSVTLGPGGRIAAPPAFMGRRVRGIRRHHAWLRKRLGRRKALRTIKRIGSVEHRKVDAELHEISRKLVDQAKALGAVLAIGDLSSIREKSRGKGRRKNRITNAMPFNRLTLLIEYKAAWAGVPVILVDESWSSRECHVCGQDGLRPTRGRFVCPACGEWHADLNGAMNIGSRAMGYMSIAGVPRLAPKRGTSSDG